MEETQPKGWLVGGNPRQ